MINKITNIQKIGSSVIIKKGQSFMKNGVITYFISLADIQQLFFRKYRVFSNVVIVESQIAECVISSIIP